jgi:hypothetical protein
MAIRQLGLLAGTARIGTVDAMSAGSFVCPACGYDRLKEPPWQDGSPSDEICPSCGIHFGYDDAAGGDPDARKEVYVRWRQAWMHARMPWFSSSLMPPVGWDPANQVRRVLQPSREDE